MTKKDCWMIAILECLNPVITLKANQIEKARMTKKEQVKSIK